MGRAGAGAAAGDQNPERYGREYANVCLPGRCKRGKDFVRAIMATSSIVVNLDREAIAIAYVRPGTDSAR